MKIITISTTILLTFTIATFAYVPITYYNDVPFKIYNGEVNVSECYNAVDLIPESYFSGITVIKIRDRHWMYGGYYHWGGAIEMLGNCQEWILVHELAHHLQYMRGDTLRNIAEHSGRFYEFEQEIKEAVYNGHKANEVRGIQAMGEGEWDGLLCGEY